MNRRFIALLLAAAAVIALAAPGLSRAQSTSPGMTVTQYAIMKERVDAFCSYYAEETKAGRPAPSGALSVKGAVGNLKYTYTATETQALVKRCEKLVALMQKTQ